MAKNGKSGGNGGGNGGNGGNRSMFKLNSGSGNNSHSLSSSSSSNSVKVFKFDNHKNSIVNSIANSNSNSSGNKVFKLNGNNSNSNHNILSFNSNKNNSNSNKFFNNKKDDCHDGKCFSKHCHNGYCYPSWYSYCHSYPSYPCYGHLTTIPLVAFAYEPLHCNYVVVPGDSYYSIAFKEYGTSLTAKHIAAFNGLGLGGGLTPGLILNLPSVSPSGALTPSGAPIADALRMSPVNANAMLPAGPMMVGGPVGPMAGPMAPMTGPVGPTSTTAGSTPVAPANMTAPRPKITVGSMLQADGQTFGDKPGLARLVIGGVALKIEVIEWLGSAVKIRLPQLELAGPSSADIEILRADGSLAAKTPVELVSATEVALAQ